ncbi:histidine phosphatase superfamily [Trichoderma sp. SZMC 28015]
MASLPNALSIFLSIAVLSLCISAQSSDKPNAKVWGVVAYINHGEKTPTLGGFNTVLTPMGARQMWRQGSAFRNRYLGTENSTTFSNSTGNYTIQGIAKDAIDNDQLTIMSQTDDWVAAGAVAFMQGLYPPTTNSFNNLAGGQEMAQDVLSNTGPIDYPLGGYQYPSIETLSLSDSASVAIQGTVGCWAWDTNVNLMKQTDPIGRARSTQSLYRSLFATPPLQGTISNGSVNYWNAYNIFEYVNYMNTHNKTVNTGLGFANTTIGVLKKNAFDLERAKNGDSLSAIPNWTYNNITTIAGQTLAMQIASSLSAATLGAPGSKLTLMFGSFEPILAFFSLMGLYNTNNLLSGPFSTFPDPGSAMIIELIGQDSGDSAALPYAQEFMVRFTYRANADVGEPFKAYPLSSDSSDSLVIPFTELLGQLQRVSQDSLQWCSTCRALYAPWCTSESSSSSDSSSTSKSSSVSAPVAGVIGAMVTLAVTGLAALALYFCGVCTFGRRAKSNLRSGSPGGFKGTDKKASDVDVAVTKRGMAHERMGSWELRNGSGQPPTGSAGIATTSPGNDTFDPRHFDDEDDMSIMAAQPVKIRESV